ncbi:alpha/beta hydrolase [Fertoebacter nigrum]|uniref:Alpha/beta hydrolase n=1 Tax=Fertoeibacter niger TaxID=2656921 RepID=A0A8X8KQP6_9RHOB|nr:alpha/beta hydrolase [Fertoeibacter niger]NUB46470.1 alpha/beta hydrolase [Fertoeibacter niger]
MSNDQVNTVDRTTGNPGPMPKGARSEFVEVNDIQLHYVTMGSGAPMILLHGWPQTWWSWRHVMERFSDRYTVIAADLRGCGLSEITKTGYDKANLAKDIAELIDKVAGGKAIVVSHDMGGKTSYMLAHLYPDRIEKLVMSDCQVPGKENPNTLDGRGWHFGFHQAENFPEMLTEGRERAYIGAQLHNWSYSKTLFSEEEITEYARQYTRPGGMTAGFNLYKAMPQDSALAETFHGKPLPFPVMTVAGRHGANNYLGDAMKLEASDFVGHIIPDCGHFVVKEAFEEFCAHLDEFLARPPAGLRN